MRWVSPFPAVFQEVSLIVGDDVAAQSVVDAVRRRHTGCARW
jgi:phenylalanyl-tRNA synthetase beta chain